MSSTHATWQLFLTSLPKARDCYGTGRNVPEMQVGVARQSHALHLDQSQPNSHQRCASAQILEWQFR